MISAFWKEIATGDMTQEKEMDDGTLGNEMNVSK
jgi:hypothetical protein